MTEEPYRRDGLPEVLGRGCGYIVAIFGIIIPAIILGGGLALTGGYYAVRFIGRLWGLND